MREYRLHLKDLLKKHKITQTEVAEHLRMSKENFATRLNNPLTPGLAQDLDQFFKTKGIYTRFRNLVEDRISLEHLDPDHAYVVNMLINTKVMKSDLIKIYEILNSHPYTTKRKSIKAKKENGEPEKAKKPTSTTPIQRLLEKTKKENIQRRKNKGYMYNRGLDMLPEDDIPEIKATKRKASKRRTDF